MRSTRRGNRSSAAPSSGCSPSGTGLAQLGGKLAALDPGRGARPRLRVVVRTAEGAVLSSVDDARAGMEISVRLRDGSLSAAVNDIHRKESWTRAHGRTVHEL